MPTLPTLNVGFAFPVGAASSDYLVLDDADRGLLDTARLAPENLWTDVTADVVSVSTSQGTQRFDGPTLRSEAGRFTVRLKDTDRSYDPTNLDGPYVAAGVTQVTPMRAGRVRATWAGTTYNVIRGFADTWDIEYSGEPNVAFVTVPCTDGFKVLARFAGIAGSPVGAGEDTGARINRILDNAGWPASDRTIATGDSTVQATTLEGNALDLIFLTADTELGEAYIDGAGKLVSRNRHASMTETRSNTSQATFGDAGSELPYHAITPVYDHLKVVNIVRATRVGGTQQVAEVATSDLPASYDRSDLLLETDEETDEWANFLLYQNKDAEYRFAEMEIRPQTAPATLFPQVLGRKLGDRITVLRRPPGGGDPIERDVFIRGISHDITPGSWVTKWALQSATKFSFLTLDNPQLGTLDNNALAY